MCIRDRRKVEQAMWQKHIDSDIRQRVLDDISEDEYMAVLRPLLKSKRKSIRAANEYELNTKLARFGISRGFSFDQIRRCLGDDVTGMTGLDIEYTDGEYED